MNPEGFLQPYVFPPTQWKHYGMPGHFIGGASCVFHLATEIGPWLISTVGFYFPEGLRTGTEDATEIGFERLFETMVFWTNGKRCDFDKCGCGVPRIHAMEIDMRGYNTAADAQAGHEELCRKWACKNPDQVRREEAEDDQSYLGR